MNVFRVVGLVFCCIGAPALAVGIWAWIALRGDVRLGLGLPMTIVGGVFLLLGTLLYALRNAGITTGTGALAAVGDGSTDSVTVQDGHRIEHHIEYQRGKVVRDRVTRDGAVVSDTGVDGQPLGPTPGPVWHAPTSWPGSGDGRNG